MSQDNATSPSLRTRAKRQPTAGWRARLALVVLTLLLGGPAFAASFPCEKARSPVEKMICADPELSALDEKLAAGYQQAVYVAKTYYGKEPALALQHRQRTWLTSVRDACSNRECLVGAYTARMAQLARWTVNGPEAPAWMLPPAMSESEILEHYVTKRRAAIKAVLEGVPLRATPRTDNAFCNGFAEAFAKQTAEVELIAPIVVSHDYKGPELKKYIFDRCPEINLRVVPREMLTAGPRNLILYHVDIDNDQKEDWLFLEEAISELTPPWGPELVAAVNFKLLDLESCQIRGSTRAGTSRRYALDADLSQVDPELGLHGIARYRDRYYIYDVINEPKTSPLDFQQFNNKERYKFSTLCVFDHR